MANYILIFIPYIIFFLYRRYIPDERRVYESGSGGVLILSLSGIRAGGTFDLFSLVFFFFFFSFENYMLFVCCMIDKVLCIYLCVRRMLLNYTQF